MARVRDAVGGREWSVDELRVLSAIFFNSSFSIGDDARDECRAIADSLGRSPASVDRQWRNMAAIVREKPGYNVGMQVRRAVAEYLSNPAGHRQVAVTICDRHGWPLKSYITGEAGELRPAITSSGEHELSDDVRGGLRRLCDFLAFKVFSSGSQGFFGQGKVPVKTRARYQGQISAVLIGSKSDLLVTVKATRDEIAWAIHTVIDRIEAKTFRTGRVGFYGSGRVRVGTENYQVSVQAVQIGER